MSSSLPQILELVSQLGNNFSSDHQKLQDLNNRLETERFHLAVLGQFKRGKSTLLNALLGEPLLPTSVIPLMAIPTYLLPSSQLQISVIYNDEKPAETFTSEENNDITSTLVRYVTEEGNPHNRQNVAYVEIFHPAPILQRGVVLIDTPGIGSTFRHNTEATLNFLPQCDAALFLISPDPPLTEVEIEFLKEVRSKVTKLFFILNKVDYLDEVELNTTRAFLKKTLREQVGLENLDTIFCLSARQGLNAQQNNDRQLWESSGLAALEDHLFHFLVSDKTDVLKSAVSKKTSDLLTEIGLRLQLTIHSLRMPLADLDKRQQLFEQKISELELQKMASLDILTGDHKRTVTFLEEQAEQLRQKAKRQFKQLIHLKLTEMEPAIPNEKIAESILAESIPAFFEHEFGEIARTFEERITTIFSSHQKQSEALVEEVRHAAAELFELTYQPLNSSGMFVYEHHPAWVTHHWRATLNPITPQLVDRFLPYRWQKSRLLKRLDEQIDNLVIVNVESLRWATLQSLDQSFRRFRSALAERFEETTSATKGAIEAARQCRLEKAETVHEAIADLEKKADNLKNLQSKLSIN